MRTAEYLTVAEVERRYPRQWVVLDKLVHGKHLEDVKGGVVVAHGTDKEKVYAVADTLPLPTDLMFFFTGPWAEDEDCRLWFPFVFWSDEEWAEISRESAMNCSYITVEDAERLFPNEWVVLDKLKTDRDGNVLGGVVVAHAPDQETVLREQDKLPKPFDLMCWHTGPIPEDVIFLL